LEKTGRVFLVGAGPGDPDLITLRGAGCLGKADVVLYDALVPVSLLALCRAGAERVDVGKTAGGRAVPQEDINRLLLSRAKEGKTVVRLKGGDPFLFSRGAEEALFLAGAGVPFEIVPGVTAALGASACAGIPVTERSCSSGLLLVTGHEAPGKEKSLLDWDLIARGKWTVVFYMALRNLEEIARRLMAEGKPGDTPAAVIAAGTTSRQRTVCATLGTIAAEVEREQLQRPAIFVVGEVVRFRERLRWLETRPLFGRTFLLLRAAGQSAEFAARLRELGAGVVSIPAIRIEPASRPEAIREAAAKVSEWDWVVFTSPNGVDRFFGALSEQGLDARAFRAARVAAVGHGTALGLLRWGIRADFLPADSTTASLGEELASRNDLEGKRLLLVRAEDAEAGLDRILEEAGAKVQRVNAYRVVPEKESAADIGRILESGAVSGIVFTSPSTVKSLAALLGCNDLRSLAGRHDFISIGPRTSEAIRACGGETAAEARRHDLTGLTEAVLSLYG
jgi:uroporphyrinogen III methyltransferase/synthase